MRQGSLIDGMPERHAPARNRKLTGRPFSGIVCRECGGIMAVKRTVHAFGYKRQYCKCTQCGKNRCVMRREFVRMELL